MPKEAFIESCINFSFSAKPMRELIVGMNFHCCSGNIVEPILHYTKKLRLGSDAEYFMSRT